jgi:hypothetical protein
MAFYSKITISDIVVVFTVKEKEQHENVLLPAAFALVPNPLFHRQWYCFTENRYHN